MELREMIESARKLRALFEELEVARHGRAWTTGEIALGFVGDVGDLAKLVQGAAGVRRILNLEAALGHELSDCLWSVLVLADRLDVDLEAEFPRTMAELSASVRLELGRGEEG